MHYHVGHNTAGYLPDSDPYVVTGKREAISASRSDARQHVDEASEYCLTCYHSAGKHKNHLGRCEHAECTYGGCTRYKAPRLSGRAGDYWVDDGRSIDTHYWVDGPCDCADGEKELADD